ncbi:hypothetical protein [Streptomyces griseosporeus]
MRAWFALKEYQDLVQRAQVPNLLKATLRFTIEAWASFRIVAALPGLVVAAVGVLLIAPVRAVLKGPKASVAWVARTGKAIGIDNKKEFQDLPPVALFRAQQAVARNLALIRASGEEGARRLGELANQTFSWSMVLLGAVLVSIASVIRLYWAYR